VPEYSGIYLVENCVAERKRGKIMNLLYKSTRNSEKTVTASEAILQMTGDCLFRNLFQSLTLRLMN
jgi:hypothetical protein